MSAKVPVKRADNDAASDKPGKEVVYIDVDDEITAIIDKLEAAKSKVVALVLPKRANALQSVVNMRLLKRGADSGNKNIVLVTTEAALLPLAGAAGIHVAKDLQSPPRVPPSPLTPVAGPDDTPDAEEEDEDEASKIDYQRSIGELAAVHMAEEETIHLKAPEDELPTPKEPKSTAPPQAKATKLKVPNFERFRLLLGGGALLLIAIIIFIILAIFVWPKAIITIKTSSTPVSANLTLLASDKYASLNEDANQIPASLKATNQTSNQTVNATGQENMGNKASGSVVMSAGACGPTVPSDVPAGSGLSANGLTFISQSDASFSPVVSHGKCTFQSNSVTIIAQNGGSNYNLPSGSSFAVAGYSGITASNNAALTGGSDNTVTVVSQRDIDNAKAKITSASSDSFTKTFENQLSNQGLYVLTSTLKIGDPTVTANPAVGQQASQTTVNIQITYTVLTLKKDDLRKIISDTLNSQIDKTKQKVSNEDILSGATVTVQNQTGPAAATLAVNEDTTAVPIIDVAQVKSLAAGKKSGDIKNAVAAWPGVKDVNVNLSPFWVSKAPKASKITVKLVQVQS